MPNTYLVSAREGEQPELQLIAIVADGGEIIPVTDGPGIQIVTIGETPESEHTATPPATGQEANHEERLCMVRRW